MFVFAFCVEQDHLSRCFHVLLDANNPALTPPFSEPLWIPEVLYYYFESQSKDDILRPKPQGVV